MREQIGQPTKLSNSIVGLTQETSNYSKQLSRRSKVRKKHS